MLPHFDISENIAKTGSSGEFAAPQLHFSPDSKAAGQYKPEVQSEDEFIYSKLHQHNFSFCFAKTRLNGAIATHKVAYMDFFCTTFTSSNKQRHF